MVLGKVGLGYRAKKPGWDRGLHRLFQKPTPMKYENSHLQVAVVVAPWHKQAARHFYESSDNHFKGVVTQVRRLGLPYAISDVTSFEILFLR